ncbi:MAG: hypothetical protein SVV03_02400 [Candidatus Nanohaloarchaea archaeon]|nr:hypothetical protein [Candidatus Nanohaloarchaea archaeon]
MAEKNKSEKSDMEKLVPEASTLTINDVELTFEPLDNEKILKSAVKAERKGQDDFDFILELIAMTISKNEGFDVTAEEVKKSKGNLLPMMNTVQEVNGLDFSEEELEEMMNS